MPTTRNHNDWLPSDDSEGSAITWLRTPSPVRLQGDVARTPSSLPPSSPTSSIGPIDSGQRVDSSDPGVDRTSPLIGPKEDQKASRLRKAARKRAATIQLNRQEMERLTHEKEAKASANAKSQQEKQQNTCAQLLGIMHSAGISLGTFLLFLFDPDTQVEGLRAMRWDEFFGEADTVDKLLTIWTTGKKTPPRARQHVTDWMVAYVAKLAGLEARRVTRSGWMRCPPEGLTKEAVLAFDLDALYPRIEETAPVTLEIVSNFATSRRQEISGSLQLRERKRKVLTQVMTSLLREHSRRNDYVAVYNGLYLYATGAQRQTISVLSHAGWSCSYPRLLDRIQATGDDEVVETASSEEAAPAASSNVSQPPKRQPQRRKGILPGLSASCMQDAQRLAASEKYKSAYDNVNFTENVAEQSMGQKDAQQNMTNATAVGLHSNDGDESDIDDALDLKTSEEAFLAAPPLDITDLMFTPDEARTWEDLLVHAAAEIVVDHGGDGFERFRTHVDGAVPPDEHQIRLHKTAIYPLQTMDIDESSTTGNIEVVDEIHAQLGVDLDSPQSAGKVRLFFGDQLTIARLRSIIASRAGHERESQSWRWAKPVLALFHTDMAIVSCVFVTHYGKADEAARDPGSLWFHNSVLDRKPIVVTSLPPYRVCRDLIFVSLYARVLHCLLQVTGQPDLTSCAGSIVTGSQLLVHARDVYRTYASASVISSLRRQHTSGDGDIVLMNSALFLRDALGLRAFCRAIKSGRSGHIVLAMKWLALMFKAGGHPKYAREMLFLIHHLVHIWPPKLRDLVLSNWLVNPTGHKDGWVALDLMQEHLNFWVKKIYAAHGSNASWEWLAMISPCIEVLRGVANQMHSALGSYQGRTHTTPALNRDIKELMKSLEEHRVYTKLSERKDVGDELTPVTDLLTEGFRQLVHGKSTSLSEHNEEFRTLQARCRVKPLRPFTAQAQPIEKETLPQASGPVQSAVPSTTDDGNESDASDSDAAAASNDGGASQSGEFEEYPEYDELFLRLTNEFDVDLDPDRAWEDPEDSDEEQDDEQVADGDLGD